ncbi:hypothetical protein [Paraburkholderia youngii]|uniref:hypothetical protein n=1 Tax=Paraburkholderia youngii TaxID=2782701 RepID=UPI003D1E8452
MSSTRTLSDRGNDARVNAAAVGRRVMVMGIGLIMYSAICQAALPVLLEFWFFATEMAGSTLAHESAGSLPGHGVSLGFSTASEFRMKSVTRGASFLIGGHNL